MLAGGSGTRLWPLSRSSVPKHLLPLGKDGRSLLEATIARLLPLGATIHVVTISEQAKDCQSVLDVLGANGEVIAEPVARGTGPALGLAVKWIARNDPDAVICSVHADHHIHDAAAYRAAIIAAAGWAKFSDGLATVGIVPTQPSTGLGYVALDGKHDAAQWRSPVTLPAAVTATHIDDDSRALPAFHAEGFIEKPPLERAQQFVSSGKHLWNTGLFAWTAKVFLRELQAANATLDAGLSQVIEARVAGDEIRAAELYAELISIAVDPLIFERTDNLTVVQASFSWSDLGSWTDLVTAKRDEINADDAGNIIEGDAITVDCEHCYVSSRGDRLIAVVGGHDLVVVDTGDAVLVVPAAHVQSVREIVDRLKDAGRAHLV